MASDVLTLSSDAVLCEYVPLPGITGFMAQRVGVGPDLHQARRQPAGARGGADP
jgi:hypothetical protein